METPTMQAQWDFIEQHFGRQLFVEELVEHFDSLVRVK